MEIPNRMIYRIVHTESGKQYVGSTTVGKKRWHGHRCDLRANRHHSFLLQRAWNKYGEAAFAFEIIETVDLSDSLEDREAYWLSELQPEYNRSWTVNAHCRGVKRGPLPSATREKIRIAVTGFKHTDATRAKMRGSRGPLNITDERRQALRKQGRKLGKTPLPAKIREHCTSVLLENAQNDKARENRSKALKGKPWSDKRQKAHSRVTLLREFLARIGGTGKYAEAKELIARRGSAARVLSGM